MYIPFFDDPLFPFPSLLFSSFCFSPVLPFVPSFPPVLHPRKLDFPRSPAPEKPQKTATHKRALVWPSFHSLSFSSTRTHNTSTMAAQQTQQTWSEWAWSWVNPWAWFGAPAAAPADQQQQEQQEEQQKQDKEEQRPPVVVSEPPLLDVPVEEQQEGEQDAKSPSLALDSLPKSSSSSSLMSHVCVSDLLRHRASKGDSRPC